MENTNKKNKRLFSKALFKQSCKANGIMWSIITAAVCFMLACVMLISGTSNISSVKDGVQDTIIQEIIKSEIKKATVNVYDASVTGEDVFDKAFATKFDELNTAENALIFNTEKAKAVAKGEALVTEKVTEYVTEETTVRLTNNVTERVTEMVTTEVTSRITKEITDAVTNDMQTPEAQTKIVKLMTEQGKTQEEAIEIVKNEYIASETAAINTSEHKALIAQQVLAEKKDEYTVAAKEEILTEENKAKTANEVLTQNKETYITNAKIALKDELESITLEGTKAATDKFTELYITESYKYAVSSVTAKYSDTDSQDYKVAMLTINPNHAVDSQYNEYKEQIPEEYISKFSTYMQNDVSSWANGSKGTSLDNYITSSERDLYKKDRAIYADSMVIAGKMTSADYKKKIVDILADFKVNEEQYDEMGFYYPYVHKIAHEGIQEFQDKYDYEVSLISADIKENNTKYQEECEKIHDEIYLTVAGSLLDRLPENVSDGIKELGTMDLYGLIVGSIFFKMAGLLLPIIYVIMVSNTLVAGQVDTGSMAYVLSTSTRREEVTFTQGLFLILSLGLMFIFTTITSCICFKIANVTTDLTYAKLLLINLGAFVTLFAISGINFCTSCFYDRSKKAMALGGGLSMFFLVCTMLGLFGSPVIPSVVRIQALNNFNYVSLISLFDVVSMLKGEYMWIYKLVILLIIGIVGYVAGSIKFKKKDLPL